ncbi:NAD dependent epimerase/dehydratase family protein [Clavispora lusitaniae]|uniref:NAD(P)-binding domain-containing protein n=2 Tax=Clavispora lusitaniae TaxID=36911 RepID=C4Y259_CLAL4|nr:uncharacterized protein CLUG_02291 [Clavispora lusitaniae ATCC 42720]EEQ38168.1 hypothetical protein CLUG_02291 [Clavispora lusitaniae ATCC 42720]KAF7582932.1 NAD dependent epimerase/dehydratase family protein [Clavispora lusitaniae]OVF10226.1 putative bifunctional protein mutarotase [Clavispora lusitaniae]
MSATFLVTGGAGFMGSHMVDLLLQEYPNHKVVCIDKLSYACYHSTKNIERALRNPNFRFLQWDLAQDYELLHKLLVEDWESSRITTVLNFAAETCVDRSFDAPLYFTTNNIVGLQNLLECLRHLFERRPELRSKLRFVHVSTDEVYGEQEPWESSAEESALKPTSPYAATKAACDLIIGAYVKSFQVAATIVRPNNVYGPRQFPEKLVSVCLTQLQKVRSSSDALALESRIPLHGSGEYTRMYLHVFDFVRAVNVILKKTHSLEGELPVFNIGTADEISNIRFVQMIIDAYMRIRFGQENTDYSKYIRFVKDRNYNDKRYAIDSSKVKALGWRQQVSLEEGITQLVQEATSHRATKL